MGLRFAVVLAASGIARGQDPDGAVAEPNRWNGPHGPPSNSRRSRAIPVTRDPVVAWVARAGNPIVAPPVLWDDLLYVLCRHERGHELRAYERRTGKLHAKKHFPASPGGNIHVWDRHVVVRTFPKRVQAVRVERRSFVSRRTFRFASTIRHMCVFENEIYVLTDKKLSRMSMSGSSEVWWQDGSLAWGVPALYGPFILYQSGRRPLRLLVASRATGQVVASKDVASLRHLLRRFLKKDRPGLVTVTVKPNMVLLGSPGPFGTEGEPACHAFMPWRFDPKKPQIEECLGLTDSAVPPAATRVGLITNRKNEEWLLWREGKGHILARKRWTPDLFADRVSPTIVGDVAYFGTWAADIVTREVLWRLPLEERVVFSVVPADRMFFLVDRFGVIRAYRGNR